MSQHDVAEQVIAQLADGKEEVRLSTQQARLLEQVADVLAFAEPVAFRLSSDGDKPPSANLRIINGRIIELWEPVLETLPRGVFRMPSVSYYRVKQRRLEIDDKYCHCIGKKRFVDGVHDECGRSHDPTPAYWNEDENRPQTFAEHVSDLQIQAMSDFDYDGHYPTIPGDDPIHFDPNKLAAITGKSTDKQKMEAFREGKGLRSRDDWGEGKNPQYLGKGEQMRGGTEIRGGRRQWRERTKEMVLVDGGFDKDVARVKARHKAKQKADMDLLKERVAKSMPRNIGEH